MKTTIVKNIKVVFTITLLINLHCYRLDRSPIEKDNNWQIYETPHLVIHVRPSDYEESDIEEIKTYFEIYYQRTVAILDVTYDRVIYCYIYSSPEDMEKHLGFYESGAADPPMETIFLSGTTSAQHEMVHVIAFWEIGQAGVFCSLKSNRNAVGSAI